MLLITFYWFVLVNQISDSSSFELTIELSLNFVCNNTTLRATHLAYPI